MVELGYVGYCKEQVDGAQANAQYVYRCRFKREVTQVLSPLCRLLLVRFCVVMAGKDALYFC